MDALSTDILDRFTKRISEAESARAALGVVNELCDELTAWLLAPLTETPEAETLARLRAVVEAVTKRVVLVNIRDGCAESAATSPDNHSTRRVKVGGKKRKA